MTNREADILSAALREVVGPREIRAVHALSGGCIHRVVMVEMGEERVVAKIAEEAQHGLLGEEADGLTALRRSGCVRVPDVFGLVQVSGHAVLFMEYLPAAAAGAGTWRAFGEALAHLHAHDAGDAYGFAADNHLGTTPQPNAWCDDWVVFNQRHRLGHQLRLAEEAGLLRGSDAATVRQVIDDLAQWIPRRPKPALLHGDLWSGNVLLTAGNDGGACAALIDPACSIGDGWADIAMMRLFGGFPPEAQTAYEMVNRDRDRLESRMLVYQLYHVLNHLNIFGTGYLSQVRTLAGALLRRR